MSIYEYVKVLVLGIVQSITEWLPISSTGHMLLVNELLPLQVSAEFQQVFFVVIQLGSILAVVALYARKLNPFNRAYDTKQRKETLSLWMKVLVGCLPAGVIGVLFDDAIDALFYDSVYVIAIALIVYGILFILVEYRNAVKPTRVKSLNELSYKDALTIGAFQMLALIPGTSRSGSTILGAMFIGIERVVAAEYSFFLAVPVMVGASFLKIVKFGLAFSQAELLLLLFGMIVAFIGSILVIRFLLAYVKRHDFKVFGYYRIVLGALVLIYFTCLR